MKTYLVKIHARGEAETRLTVIASDSLSAFRIGLRLMKSTGNLSVRSI